MRFKNFKISHSNKFKKSNIINILNIIIKLLFYMKKHNYTYKAAFDC